MAEIGEGARGISKRRRSQSGSSKVKAESKLVTGGSLCSQCRLVPLPAHKAAYLGHIECLEGLHRDAPGKLEMVDKNGALPLHLAARQSNSDTVKWLMENYPDQHRAKALGGETPMLIAAAQGSKECLSVLASLSRKEVVRDTDINGLSSVHLASLYDRGSCVGWLLKHFGHRIVVLQSQSGITPVHIASAKGNLSVLKQLLRVNKKGATTVDASGAAPAYFAAQEGRQECFQYLIQRAKADALAKCSDGMTSVHAAAQGGHLDILKIIVETVGESVLLTPMQDKGTPVHYAAATGHHEALEWMLSFDSLKGAVNLTDNDLGTPAHDAADNSQVKCLRVLKKHGANMAVKDKDGATPISLALESDDPECRRWAIEERKLLDPAKRPSRMESDALATLELTRLVTEGKRHVLPGVVEQTSPTVESNPIVTAAPSPPAVETPASSTDTDIYAVPHKGRARKKKWDGSGPARLPAPDAEKAAENALAATTEVPLAINKDHGDSDDSDLEDVAAVRSSMGIGSPLMESTPVKPPDSSSPADHPGLPLHMPEIADPESPTADKKEDSANTDGSDTIGSELLLTPKKPAQVIRPKSATAARSSAHATLDLSRSNSDPPTPSRVLFDKNGKPINTNYPRLTRQGIFDSPNASPHASPAASPCSSPLVLRKPFSFAAKPPSSPSVARAHSLPKTQPNEAADTAAAVKKSSSLGNADSSKHHFIKKADVASFLHEDSDDDLDEHQ